MGALQDADFMLARSRICKDAPKDPKESLGLKQLMRATVPDLVSCPPLALRFPQRRLYPVLTIPRALACIPAPQPRQKSAYSRFIAVHL